MMAEPETWEQLESSLDACYRNTKTGEVLSGMYALRRLNALEQRLREAEQARDSIQHQEVAAAQVEFNAMRDRAVAAEEELTAYRKAWELPEQPITQGVVPSAGEVAANAVEHAHIYKDQRDAAEQRAAQLEVALMGADNGATNQQKRAEEAEQRAERYKAALAKLDSYLDFSVEFQPGPDGGANFENVESINVALAEARAALAEPQET